MLICNSTILWRLPSTCDAYVLDHFAAALRCEQAGDTARIRGLYHIYCLYESFRKAEGCRGFMSWNPSDGTTHPSDRTGDVDEPWYVFDQALFSGDLVSKTAKVELITKVRRQSLLSPGVLQPGYKGRYSRICTQSERITQGNLAFITRRWVSASFSAGRVSSGFEPVAVRERRNEGHLT